MSVIKSMKVAGVAATTAMFLAASQCSAAVILADEDFQNLSPNTFASTGLQLLGGAAATGSNSNSLYLGAGPTTDTSRQAVDTGNGSFITSGSLSTIAETTNFALMTKLAPTGSTSTGGGVGFGLSKSATSTTGLDPYNPGAVEAPKQLLVGLRRTAAASETAGDFRLSWANAGINGVASANDFGTTATTLDRNHWYRISGSIAFDETTSQYTLTATVDDWGVNGDAFASTKLTGSVLVTSLTTFADSSTQVQPLFWANQQRGTRTLDNLYAEAVPEPASLALVGLAGLAAGRRRRR